MILEDGSVLLDSNGSNLTEQEIRRIRMMLVEYTDLIIGGTKENEKYFAKTPFPADNIL